MLLELRFTSDAFCLFAQGLLELNYSFLEVYSNEVFAPLSLESKQAFCRNANVVCTEVRKEVLLNLINPNMYNTELRERLIRIL